jgi:carbon monoxide dehydrogenase subunit G
MTNLTRAVRMSLFAGAMLTGCGEQAVDWSAPENLMLREKSGTKDNDAVLEYWSLIDAPCKPIYDALTDVEHYPDFVPGIDRANLLSSGENSKTVQIAQRVISRQSNAKVEWKFDPARQHIEFNTLTSDLSFNDGSYDLQASPDGKRCLVTSKFLVKASEAVSLPVGVLASGTRDAFLSAAKGVRKRVTGR